MKHDLWESSQLSVCLSRNKSETVQNLQLIVFFFALMYLFSCLFLLGSFYIDYITVCQISIQT